jgi:hypothetical protein
MAYATTAEGLVSHGYAVLYLPHTRAAASATAGSHDTVPESEEDPAQRLPGLLSAIRFAGTELLHCNAPEGVWPSAHTDLDRASGFARVRRARMNLTFRGLPLPLLPTTASGAASAPEGPADLMNAARNGLVEAFPAFLEVGQHLLHHFGVAYARSHRLVSSPHIGSLLPLLPENPMVHMGTDSGGSCMSSVTMQQYDSRALAPTAFCGHSDPGSSRRGGAAAEVEVNEHIDCTLLTMVAPGLGDSCLQVFDKLVGAWVDPFSMPHCQPPKGEETWEPIVIMSGYLLPAALGRDFMEAYTAATLHRVIVPPGHKRASVVMRLLPRARADLNLNRAQVAMCLLHEPDALATAIAAMPTREAREEVEKFRGLCASVNSSSGLYHDQGMRDDPMRFSP